MRPIDLLISETAAPVLKRLGFRRSGRWFYYQGSAGDIGVISFGTLNLGMADATVTGIAELYVRELHEDRGWEWPTKLAGAMTGGPIWKKSLRLPDEHWRLSAVGDQAWNINLDDEPAREAFAGAMEELANELVTLTDRDNFVAWLRRLDPDATDPRLGAWPVARALSIIKAQ